MALGTHELQRCHDGDDHFISNDMHCEGKTVDTPLGYIWNTASTAANVAIYRCLLTDGTHMTSVSATCEGAGKVEEVVGYGKPA